jgi:hypothetical protein
MTKYVTVDISTVKGFDRAEWYHAHGWKAVRTGLFYILFAK